MLVLMLLVIFLFGLLAVRKVRAKNANLVDLKKTALDNSAWNDEVVVVSNNIANQFETPILFYALCLLVMQSGVSDTLFISLAWLYVALRYLHAYVHISSNFVPVRMKIFAASLIVLLVIMIRLFLTTIS
ncbi:MAG: hypothetical protein GJ680_13560 [Alteromonadaceae bacterium]|nr:hypothetical protein [Alteromonadaceae bacterium]